MKQNIEHESDEKRLRVEFLRSDWRFDRLTPSQQEALVRTTQYVDRPQPIDYDLSRFDVCVHWGRYPLDDGLTYREESDLTWHWFFLRSAMIYVCALAWMLYLPVKGSSSELWKLAAVLVPFSLVVNLFLSQVIEPFANAYRRRRSKRQYLSYQNAVDLHDLYQSTAQAAAKEAEQAALRKKRSYWAFVDGYAFERATAEVLRKHLFTATVTRAQAMAESTSK